MKTAFRTLKSKLEIGPIYHYAERRIKAHIFICFLALLLKITFHKNLCKIDKTFSLNKVLKNIKICKPKNVQLYPLVTKNIHYLSIDHQDGFPMDSASYLMRSASSPVSVRRPAPAFSIAFFEDLAPQIAQVIPFCTTVQAITS